MTREAAESLPGAAKVAALTRNICLFGGLGLIVLGSVMFISSWRTRLAAKSDERLTIPIASNQMVKTNFTASGKFPISIDFSLSRQQSNSNKRIDPAHLEQFRQLNLEWSLRDGTSVIASGNATNARHYNPHAAYYRSTPLGFVRPGHAGTYEFAAKLNSDLPAGMSPTIALKPFAGRAMVNAGMKNFVGGILCMLGIFVPGIALLTVSRRKS